MSNILRKIEYNDETYYYVNNQFLDSNFLVVDTNTSQKLANEYFRKVDYRSLAGLDLLDFITELKTTGAYLLVIEVGEYGMHKFGADSEFASIVLPMMTSSYRQLKLPKKAIDYAEVYLQKFPYILRSSGALCTSLAAAYCDIKNYHNAKRYADLSRAINKNKGVFSSELNAVYARLEKEAGEIL